MGLAAYNNSNNNFIIDSIRKMIICITYMNDIGFARRKISEKQENQVLNKL